MCEIVWKNNARTSGKLTTFHHSRREWREIAHEMSLTLSNIFQPFLSISTESLTREKERACDAARELFSRCRSTLKEKPKITVTSFTRSGEFLLTTSGPPSVHGWGWESWRETRFGLFGLGPVWKLEKEEVSTAALPLTALVFI